MSIHEKNRSGTHTWLVLMKAHHALARHAERSILALGVCMSDFIVLEMLLHKGPKKVNDIGRSIGLTSGAITTAVDRLAQRGLVVRGADPEDRRARVVSLTAAGRAASRSAFDQHSAAMEKAADGLSKKEQEALRALLKKLGKSAAEMLQEELGELS